jgi:hypothetical protein
MADRQQPIDPRSRQTREQERIIREQLASEYSPPATLPELPEIPGVRWKWVATHVLGQYEPTSASRSFRDGWEPVKATDPVGKELGYLANSKGLIEIGGLLLCKGSAEQMKKRDAYYEQQSVNQQRSVEAQFMRGGDPRMPLFSESRTTVSRGNGSGS